jgi:hypothetical protein
LNGINFLLISVRYFKGNGTDATQNTLAPHPTGFTGEISFKFRKNVSGLHVKVKSFFIPA